MKFRRLICLILAAILATFMCAAYAGAAQADQQDTSATLGSHGLDASMSLLGEGRLVSNTKAALLYETKTQTLLYSYNADERMYPSSFVKLMTLLIALEEGDLEEVITVRQETLNSVPYDAMTVNLYDGEQLTLNDLLYCMMVGSGNDAAAVIAEAIAGTQTAFVEKMNAYAASIGCMDTNFMNVHGLHHDNQYTTARDSAKIFVAGLKNDKFREIICAQTFTIPESENSRGHNLLTNNYLINTNIMEIYKDGRVLGGRTGVTNDRERCVASLSRSGNMELICIVMGSKSTYEADGYSVRLEGGFPETSALLDRGYQGFRGVQLFHKDQVMRQLTIMGGDCDLFLGTQFDAFTVLPASVTLDDLSFVYRDTFGGAYPDLPIEKGQTLSNVEVWYEDICVASSPLLAMNQVVTEQPIYIESSHFDSSMPWWGWVLIILGAALVLFLAFILAVRYISAFRHLLFGKKRRKFRW